MSYYDKKHDQAQRRGKEIAKEIKAAERVYGSYTAMICAEIQANRKGKLFIRPK